jgi:hypothetical protein
MGKENSEIIPAEFLDELVQSINQQYGWPASENTVDPFAKEDE